jgi:hypothetical protein
MTEDQPAWQNENSTSAILISMTSNYSKTKTFWIVTALVVCVLIFVLFQFGRVRMSIRLADFIESLTPSISQPYLLVGGLVWAAAGLLVMWWLVRRSSLAPTAFKALAVLYSINYWVEQLWLTQSELRSTNWAFSALINAALLILVFVTFSFVFVRKIFGEHHGREPKNQ